MLDKTLARRYANALYSSAFETRETAVVLADLERIRASIAAIPDFKKVLYNPAITPDEKKKLMADVFSGSINQSTKGFIDTVLDAQRINYLDLIHEAFLFNYNRDNNKAVVRVTTCRPLPQELLERIKTKLTKMLGKEIDMQVQIDERILGGISIDIAGDVIDGSIAYRLNKMSEKMLAG
jgi:F-type H+-transporting ATPase subunit delta